MEYHMHASLIMANKLVLSFPEDKTSMACSANHRHLYSSPLEFVCMQVVCITDPVLATQVLRSKFVDKLRFEYSFLDPVSTEVRVHRLMQTPLP